MELSLEKRGNVLFRFARQICFLNRETRKTIAPYLFKIRFIHNSKNLQLSAIRKDLVSVFELGYYTKFVPIQDAIEFLVRKEKVDVLERYVLFKESIPKVDIIFFLSLIVYSKGSDIISRFFAPLGNMLSRALIPSLSPTQLAELNYQVDTIVESLYHQEDYKKIKLLYDLKFPMSMVKILKIMIPRCPKDFFQSIYGDGKFYSVEHRKSLLYDSIYYERYDITEHMVSCASLHVVNSEMAMEAIKYGLDLSNPSFVFRLYALIAKTPGVFQFGVLSGMNIQKKDMNAWRTKTKFQTHFETEFYRWEISHDLKKPRSIFEFIIHTCDSFMKKLSGEIDTSSTQIFKLLSNKKCEIENIEAKVTHYLAEENENTDEECDIVDEPPQESPKENLQPESHSNSQIKITGEVQEMFQPRKKRKYNLTKKKECKICRELGRDGKDHNRKTCKFKEEYSMKFGSYQADIVFIPSKKQMIRVNGVQPHIMNNHVTIEI